MSTSPIAWRDTVIKHYGSIAEFHDVSTVEIMRQHIAARRADLKTVLDLEGTHPGVVIEKDLADMKAEDAELAALDGELEQWQAVRNKETA